MPTRARLNHPNDLGEEVFDILHKADPFMAERFRTLYLNQLNPPLGAYPVDTQIRALNEYWRVQLGLVDGDTVTARYGLVEGIPPEVWVGNFHKYVMPTIRKFGVPMQPAFPMQVEKMRWMRYIQ